MEANNDIEDSTDEAKDGNIEANDKTATYVDNGNDQCANDLATIHVISNQDSAGNFHNSPKACNEGENNAEVDRQADAKDHADRSENTLQRL